MAYSLKRVRTTARHPQYSFILVADHRAKIQLQRRPKQDPQPPRNAVGQLERLVCLPSRNTKPQTAAAAPAATTTMVHLMITQLGLLLARNAIPAAQTTVTKADARTPFVERAAHPAASAPVIAPTGPTTKPAISQGGAPNRPIAPPRTPPSTEAEIGDMTIPFCRAA